MNKSDFHTLISNNINSVELNIHFINSTRLGGRILRVFNDYIDFSGKNEDHFSSIPISSILNLEFNAPPKRESSDNYNR